MFENHPIVATIAAAVIAGGITVVGCLNGKDARNESFTDHLHKRLNTDARRMEDRCALLVGKGNLFQLDIKQALMVQNSNFKKQQMDINQMLAEFREQHYHRMWSHFQSSADQLQQGFSSLEYQISDTAQKQAQAIESMARDVKETQQKISQLNDFFNVPSIDENIAKAGKELLKGKKDVGQVFHEFNLIPNKETFFSLARVLGDNVC